MAINKNHEFEDLEGIKCAIVEKNTSTARLQFLKDLLSHNGYQVVIAETAAPKAAPEAEVVVTAPTTYTVGVTDLTFNPTNAVFGRILKTIDGHIVTLAYWQQKANVSDDTTPYFDQP